MQYIEWLSSSNLIERVSGASDPSTSICEEDIFRYQFIEVNNHHLYYLQILISYQGFQDILDFSTLVTRLLQYF